MAYAMRIRGTEHEVKVRNPWAVALLPIMTLGDLSLGLVVSNQQGAEGIWGSKGV